MGTKKEQLLSLLSSSCDLAEELDGEIRVSCPFAAWTHSKGTDSNPSMFVKAADGEPSLVYCFACHASFRTVADMMHALTRYSSFFGQFIVDAREIEDESLIALVSTLPAFDKKLGVKAGVLPFPETAYSTYTRKWATYLESRGVTKESGMRWDIGYDERRRRITIPVRDRAGGLFGCVGRTVCGEEPRYYNYWKFDKGRFLLGEHLVTKGTSLVVVEGPLDAVVASQHLPRDAYSVVSTMGSSASKAQQDRIVGIADHVVIAYDGDKAGSDGASKLYAAIRRRVRTLIATLPDGADPGALGGEILPFIAGAGMPLGI